MKKLFYLLFLSLWMFISCQRQAQIQESNNYKLFVTLENAPFDSLYLCDYTGDRKIYIAGEKTNEFTWEITIPDSIVLNSENLMSLAVSKYAFIGNSLSATIRFIAERDEKKIAFANIGVEDRENYIYAVYMGKTVFPEELIGMTIEGKDTIFFGNYICEDFKLILQNDSSDITIRAQDPLFSWFSNMNNEELSYNEYLERYDELSKKYPDSRFLMSSLSHQFYRYQSKSDLQRIYDNLSDKYKNTEWAKNIESYLQTKFENTSLPTLNKDTYEDIVQDSSKYNLIIFTASWCRPCIEEIPVLKEIYNDLNKNLVMTYISVDEEKTVKSFQKQMREKNIPWRALLAYEDIEKIKTKYFVSGIPQGVLVYPDGTMSLIEVRDKEQREKLYSLCGK